MTLTVARPPCFKDGWACVDDSSVSRRDLIPGLRITFGLCLVTGVVALLTSNWFLGLAAVLGIATVFYTRWLFRHLPP
jgi:hypothetical protein